ncbi:hypothetical protein BDQ17DRAFT_962988 [Cyathus striatus]|nr:hypothetical protein BDQ17DRAFT_962988 [Cyathus striatus]
MEDDSMAENSRSDNSYSFNDGNLSDDPLARPLSPSPGELNYVPDDEYHLDDEPQPTSPTPPSDNDDTTGEPKTYGGLPALVWKQYRKDPANFGRKVHWGRDIPHSLEDQINGMSKLNRMHPQMRNIMLAAIRQNTVEDEQDAPDIIIENEVDDEPTPPWEFHYSNQLWHADDVPPPDMKSLVSCDCIGKCDPKSKTCACVRRQGAFFHEGDPADFVYDSRGRLKKPGFPIFECNDACSCNDDCRNRVVQNGRTVSVKIAKTPNKGWGVFAGPRKIPKGTFLGVYSGELITDAAGEQRGKVYNTFGRTYLFDLDFHHLRKDDPDWDVKYTVDAYHAGNFTRFLNHSCDPNARLLPATSMMETSINLCSLYSLYMT